MPLIEREDFIIKCISSNQGILTIIKLSKGYFSIGVYEGLLIYSSYPFDCTYVVGILSP